MARYKVVKGAAVVKLAGGGERYVYRGSVFDGEPVAAESIKHLLAVGLIEKVATAKAKPEPTEPEPTEPEPTEPEPTEPEPTEPAKRGPGRPPKAD